jgi:uncharacterized protein (TIGR02599 family)
MEFRQPAESIPLFLQDTATLPAMPTPLIRSQTTPTDLYRWFREGRMGSQAPQTRCDLTTGSRVLAQNILALIISPRLPTDGTAAACDYDVAPNYFYDSREYQLATQVNSGSDRNGVPIKQVTRSQLPPVLEITLLAMDDRSWQSYLDRGGSDSRYLDYVNTRFRTVGPLAVRSNPAHEQKLKEDLEELQRMLSEDKISHRVFSCSVELRAAKWTTDSDLARLP